MGWWNMILNGLPRLPHSWDNIHPWHMAREGRRRSIFTRVPHDYAGRRPKITLDPDGNSAIKPHSDNEPQITHGG